MAVTTTEKLLFNRAFTDPSFGKGVFNDLPLTSFSEESRELVQLIKRHYLSSNDTISEDEMNLHIENRFDLDDPSDLERALSTKELVSESFEVTEGISQGVISDTLNKHVREVLSARAISTMLSDGTLDNEGHIRNLGTELVEIALMDIDNTQDANFLDVINDSERKIELYNELRRATYPTGFPNLDAILEGGGLGKGEVALLIAPTGTGKALVNGTKVQTPEGPVNIEDLEEGSKVFGRDGKAHNVIGVFPQGKKRVYEVEFSDGTVIENNDEHIWTFQTASQRGDTYTTGQTNWTTATLREIIDNYPLYLEQPDGYKKKNIYLPMPEPVEYEEKDLPVDPYLLGALLGDGGLADRSIHFTNSEEDVLNKVDSKLEEIGYYLKHSDRTSYRVNMGEEVRKTFYGSVGTNNGPNALANPLSELLKKLGLSERKSYEKFVPSKYLQGSIKQRTELLRGLIDTDGYVANSGVTYSTSSPHLAEDVKELANSLGMVGKITTKEPQYRYKGELKKGKTSYNVYIKIPRNGILPFSSEKHKNNFTQGQTQARRTIVDIRETDRYEEMTCISVDAEDELFLTENFIPTHNTSLSVQAAINNVFDGQNVLYITLEERLGRMAMRMDMAMFGASQDDFYDKSTTLINEQVIKNIPELLKTNYPDIGNLYISKHGPQTLTIEGLEQVIVDTKIKKGINIDVVIIDYPALLKTTEPTDSNMVSNIGGRTFERIRDLSQKHNFVCYTLAQTNRAAASQDLVTAEYIEGSKKVLNACELVLTLNRTKAEYQNQYFRLYVDKNRNRSHGPQPDILSFRIDLKGFTIRASDPAEEAEHKSILADASRYTPVDNVTKGQNKADKINNMIGGS